MNQLKIDHTQARPASDRTVIRLQDVTKEFVLHRQKPFLMREMFNRLRGKRALTERFTAVSGVSLEIQEGEFVGFIGHNGAGKSTLLGLISGTLNPSRGTVEVQGRLGSLLELGAGFHPDLTGRENIFLNASLLGLTRDQVEDQFDSIVEFSELEKFIDVPIGNYSSGMQVRLGFSVAVHINPDVLIMDEILAVGDEAFQHKCISRIESFHRQGKTMIIVSHNMTHIRNFCTRAFWLDHGRLMAAGEPQGVVDQYLSTYG